MAQPCLLDLLVRVSRRPSPLWARLTDVPTVRRAWEDAIGDLAQRRQMKRCYPRPELLSLRLTNFGRAFEVPDALIARLLKRLAQTKLPRMPPAPDAEVAEWAYRRRGLLSWRE
ncbi:MAG: hypothetical protein ACREKH_14665 [Candidatus Rokuibacteriota bacterium]